MAVVLTAPVLVNLRVGLADAQIDLLLTEDEEAAEVVDVRQGARAKDQVHDLVPGLAAEAHLIERGQRRPILTQMDAAIESAVLPLVELDLEGNFQ